MDDAVEQPVYCNARIRGMKSRLMPRAALDDLLDQGDPNVIIEVLLNSEYKTEMATALTRYAGVDAIEDAVSRNLSRTFQRLLELARGAFRGLAEVFLTRWDVVTVKGLLRNRYHREQGENDPRLLYPGPNLGPALLEELAARPSLAELLEGLAVWNPALCRPLLEAPAPRKGESGLTVLENALDRAYLVETARRLARARDIHSAQLLRVLRMSIDGLNLRILLFDRTLEPRPADALERLLPEGTLPVRVLEKMSAARNVEQAMELLGATQYREVVERLYLYVQTGRFAPLERLLEGAIVRELRRMATARVLSLAVLMYYAWLKNNEVVNLRVIARGEARHLPRGRVREELMYV